MKKNNDGTRKGSVGSAADSPAAKEKPMNRLSRPTVPSHVKNLLELRRQRDKAQTPAETLGLDARVIIVEGIAGAGKDTFQAYLKEKLKGREVYNYSEGDLLHSWKHFSIRGILELRVKFEKLFVLHLREFLSREKDAVFLLNRFHLSTYVALRVRQPELTKEYDEVIRLLKTLPVHVFILQVDESEIDRRSSHAERSRVYRKLQQQLTRNDGFSSRAEKYKAQQRLILDTARELQLPYSVIQISASRREWRQVSTTAAEPRARAQLGSVEKSR
jgi:thymidylate kinase